ncbi:right-handed parallel beta-helix repeat-containing protein [Alloacidobacterium sp.]|uniref:right-handed parallel beta-helix repeat-containing protein n=1 Tax=Alloacidobacterium sp. TaxID=2951999 RepID=UPI002D3E84F5|nr:right-handed parallel beta-helix repeat-containing protein [Alloacidobacterium sp.]HYK37276.1 right-handed parallel beta-helix repeat-containing protein [Alloacidobacterium sp.]
MSTKGITLSLSGHVDRNTSKTITALGTCSNFCRAGLLLLVVMSVLVTAARAQSYYYVDCSGTNPNDYATIGAALAVAGSGSYVIVTGTCNENVTISNAWNLNLGAAYGQTANIAGGVTVTGSNSVFLYGLNVTNPFGDAFNITSSHNVTLWNCTANGNQGSGVSVHSLSDVTVDGPGSFDENGGGGLTLNDNSFLTVLTFAGPVDISGNHGPGVSVGGGAEFATLGNTAIENNINTAAPDATRQDGFGIQEVSASKAQVATCYGGNQISGNESGGVDVREHSFLSIWGCGAAGGNILQNNGAVGLEVGLGSEVALYSNVVISGHTGSGVELYAQGQLYMFGPNVISQNGNAGDARSAGVVVDGNSEAYLRGGTLSKNEGPGILALVNSSVDSVGATFSGNADGNVTCDSSAYLVSDLLPSNPHHGVVCRTPHHLGNRHDHSFAPVAPDFTQQMNRAAQYKKFASRK